MTQSVFKINGMTCMGCARLVTKRLMSIAGVEEVKVDVEGGSAAVKAGRPVTVEEAGKVLEGTHYNVVKE